MSKSQIRNPKSKIRALTLDAPWAWAILWGPKRVENRSWQTAYRGPLAIHFGLNKSRDAEAIRFLQRLGLDVPEGAALNVLRGQIHGVVDLVDVVPFKRTNEWKQLGAFMSAEQLSSDPWAFGPWCWLLENVRVLDVPVPARGSQGLWTPLAEASSPVRLQNGARGL